MYVHIFGYLVNKLEIWWVYLSPIERQNVLPLRTLQCHRLCMMDPFICGLPIELHALSLLVQCILFQLSDSAYIIFSI